MLTINTRNLFRVLALFVMIFMMLNFVGVMAAGYMSSIQCISTSISYCETANIEPNILVVSSEPGTDEWLCEMGDTNHCGLPNGMTVALQTK